MSQRDMRNTKSTILAALLLPFLYLLLLSPSTADIHHDFLRCISSHHGKTNATSITKVIYYTPANSTSYTSALQFPVANRRFLQPSTPRPQLIVTPTEESHVQTTVLCGKTHGLDIRPRSGSHDYEGLSYVGFPHIPFIIIDLIRLRQIKIDVKARTAWVQTGATNGELYYNIGTTTGTLGFTAGVCPTVGLGGHVSGGGWGPLMRKYGIAADNVLDARVVDAEGRILDKETMGEDFFWAIRGGGGGNFGIIVAWKLNLVPVPSIITVFTVNVTGEEKVTDLVHRYQYVADKLPKELFIRITVQTINSSSGPNIQAMLRSLFLGRLHELLPLMRARFPELGLKKEHCKEMSWFESVIYFSEFGNGNSPRDLLNRTPAIRAFSKGKSDYVREPIPKSVFNKIWKFFYKVEVGVPTLFLTPYGGRMSEIQEWETPYPHRGGNQYQLQYTFIWNQNGVASIKRHMGLMRALYAYMAPFVTKNPRAAYVNYRDLDIGMNDPIGITSYRKASVWGNKYFKGNFRRLVHVKTMVDPTNLFRNQQSVPPLTF